MNSRTATQMMIRSLCPKNPPPVDTIPPVPIAFLYDLDNVDPEMVEAYADMLEAVLPFIYRMILDPDFREQHSFLNGCNRLHPDYR